MSISKKYCQPCGAPPNIYDDGHIILLSQNCRDCIQPCSTLRLIPVRVRGGISMSHPPFNQWGLAQPDMTYPQLHPHWLSALVNVRGSAPWQYITPHTLHSYHQKLLNHRAEQTSNRDQTCSEEARLQTETIPAEDKPTAQRKLICRLYS